MFELLMSISYICVKWVYIADYPHDGATYIQTLGVPLAVAEINCYLTI